jgi:PEGA domain
MGEPGDDDDQIFTGPALGEDGALRLKDTQPMFLKIPPSPGGEIAPSPGGEIPPPPGARPPAAQPRSPMLEPLFDNALVPKSHFAEAPPLQHGSLELAERPPRPPPEFAPMPVPDRPVRPPSLEIHWFRWFLVLALLAAVAGGVFVVTTARKTVDRLLAPGVLERLIPGNARPGQAGKGPSGTGTDEAAPAEKRVGTPAPSLLVLSEPTGATVLIGGAVVGITPWAGDNVWPKGPLRVEVRKAGYRSWAAMVEGGVEQTVEATLRRR